MVPWRPGCPHRERAWQWLRLRHEQHGHAVVEADSPGEWCKALAVSRAVASIDSDIVVMHDADVWCDGIDEAIAAVKAGAPWAVPHRTVMRLSEAATDDVYRTGMLGGDLAQRPYRGHPGGGILVLPRTTYLEVPLDPRYTGWGQEDDSWYLALHTLLGHGWRGTADLWHLWHPPAQRLSRVVGSPASKALFAQYRSARTIPARMEQLVADARALLEGA